MGSQQFCLKWNNHQRNLVGVLHDVLFDESFVDVTLACDGKSLKAHKIILSACSPFFEEILKANPCNHPVLILKDLKFNDLKTLLDFMYNGEVSISQENLSSLLKTAESLKIKGLTDLENYQNNGTVSETINALKEDNIIRNDNSMKISGPTAKKIAIHTRQPTTNYENPSTESTERTSETIPSPRNNSSLLNNDRQQHSPKLSTRPSSSSQKKKTVNQPQYESTLAPISDTVLKNTFEPFVENVKIESETTAMTGGTERDTDNNQEYILEPSSIDHDLDEDFFLRNVQMDDSIDANDIKMLESSSSPSSSSNHNYVIKGNESSKELNAYKKQCPYCMKLFHPVSVKRHIRSVHFLNRVVCTKCKKTFCRNDVLKQHMTICTS